jgi:hypothetical protein
MKLNTQRLLEHCIDEGIKDALAPEEYYDKMADKISDAIWLAIDYYFDFEE